MTDFIRNLVGRATAPIGALAVALDGLGNVTEFTGEELDALGELQQQLASIVESARDKLSGEQEA